MVKVGVTALGALIAVVGGAIGLWMARREWALRREIKGAEGVDAGALKRGVVELAGRAVPAGETFTSPLTGQECVAYEFEVEERQRRRSGGRDGRTARWKTVTDVERAAPFYLEDGTGRAMVDAPVADFELERAYAVDTDDVATGTTGKMIATITGGDTASDLPVTEERREEIRSGGRRRRYYERLVRPDETVYVYGEAMSPAEVPRGEGGLGDVAGMIASSEGTSGSLLGGAISAAGGDTRGYRRAKRRGHEARDFGGVGPSESELEESRREMERRADELEELQGRDPEEMTDAERRRMAEMAREMQDDVGMGMGSFGSALDDVAEAAAGGGDDPFAGESLVVSRGETIGEFVLSDREKGEVIRSYSTSTLKWVGLALASLVVGGAAVAYGVGLVSFGTAGPLGTGLIGVA